MKDANLQGVYVSCGNVFEDLGLPDADMLLAKADLSLMIRRRMDELGIGPDEAEKLFETERSEVSLVMNGRVGEVTLERLFRFLNALRMDMTITLTPTADHQRGKILVTSV